MNAPKFQATTARNMETRIRWIPGKTESKEDSTPTILVPDETPAGSPTNLPKVQSLDADNQKLGDVLPTALDRLSSEYSDEKE